MSHGVLRGQKGALDPLEMGVTGNCEVADLGTGTVLKSSEKSSNGWPSFQSQKRKICKESRSPSSPLYSSKLRLKEADKKSKKYIGLSPDPTQDTCQLCHWDPWPMRLF